MQEIYNFLQTTCESTIALIKLSKKKKSKLGQFLSIQPETYVSGWHNEILLLMDFQTAECRDQLCSSIKDNGVLKKRQWEFFCIFFLRVENWKVK